VTTPPTPAVSDDSDDSSADVDDTDSDTDTTVAERAPERRHHGRLHRWLHGAAVAMTVVLAVALVVPALLGVKRYVIVSGSMEPTIPVGSVVYDEVVPVEDIAVGDVITFVPPPQYGLESPVTHRVASITETPEGQREFRTKGDANETIDPWVFYLDGPEQARVILHIEYVGWIYIFLSQRWVQLLLIAVPASVLFVYLLIALWRLAGDAVVEERKKRARGGTPT
jgi:signal peptidase